MVPTGKGRVEYSSLFILAEILKSQKHVNTPELYFKVGYTITQEVEICENNLCSSI